MNRLLENWDYTDTTHQRYYTTGLSTPTITANGRRGTRCADGTTAEHYGAYFISASGATLIVGAAVEFPTASGLGKIFGFGDPTASGMLNCYVRANDDRSVSVYRADDTLLGISQPNLLTFGGGYNYIEARVTIGNSGAAEVRIGGLGTVLLLTNIDTFRNGSTTPSLLWIYPQGRRRYDDLYINDLLGSQNIDFEGDVRIDAHFPNAVGNSSQFNRSVGDLQYATVDEETPDEDSTYNSTGTIDALDTLGVENLIPVGAGVKAVSVLTRERITDTGSASHAAVVRSSSTDHVFASHVLTSGYAYYETPNAHLTVPSLLSDAGFNAAEFGYKRTS